MIYFDNAATRRPSERVLEAVLRFYREEDANPGRGIYKRAAAVDLKLFEARKTVAELLGCLPEEVVFTSGTTEGLNMMARGLTGLLERSGAAGARVLVGRGEHHSNLLPWAREFSEVEIVDCDDYGRWDLADFKRKLKKFGGARGAGKTGVVAVNLMGNVFGGVNAVKEITEAAHRAGAVVVGDGAQAVGKMEIDVAALGLDALAFSGHKMGAPMGTGALYIRKELLEKLEPYRLGGGMVAGVSVGEKVEWESLAGPVKMEAGTVNMGGIIGLAEAVKEERDHEYVARLGEKLLDELKPVTEMVRGENGIVSFQITGVHPHDVAQILDEEGIAVRAGYMCAQPLLDFLKIGPVVRASLSEENTEAEVEKFIEVVAKVREKMHV